MLWASLVDCFDEVVYNNGHMIFSLSNEIIKKNKDENFEDYLINLPQSELQSLTWKSLARKQLDIYLQLFYLALQFVTLFLQIIFRQAVFVISHTNKVKRFIQKGLQPSEIIEIPLFLIHPQNTLILDTQNGVNT